ncbi:MAG: aminodeoxychorismate synthase component I [Saprospiraceae bacterium]|nr:MAG: aminodeoxychorismate synthase component I [Saprospiraceae bacterium]
MKPDAWNRMNHLGKCGVPFLFITGFEDPQPLLFRLEELDREAIIYALPGQAPTEGIPFNGPWLLKKYPQSFSSYRQGFDLIQQHIANGDTFLLNYTCATPVETNLSLREIFRHSRAKYKLLFKDRFVCFSPETFVQINSSGTIRTHPMKGTIDARMPDAANLILNDRKETAEHYTIVDLLRNDLSQVAKGVRVERFRYLDKIDSIEKPLLQVSSEIAGALPAGWPAHLGSIFKTLLPAGSVSGAPKKKTLEIIAHAENRPRGFYTGVFGIFDGQSVDSSVMIRFIEKTENGLVYQSGGGITCFSDPAAEYQEMIDKVYLPLPKHSTLNPEKKVLHVAD